MGIKKRNGLIKTYLVVNTVREVEEHPLDPFFLRIGGINVVFQHIVQEAGAMRGQQGFGLLVNLVYRRGKLFQRHCGIVLEIPGQEVIKINIHEHAAVFFKTIVKQAFAGFKQGVCIGKGVDLPVQVNAFYDFFGIILEMTAPHMVRNKIPDQQVFVIVGQKGVCQVIHCYKNSYF